MTYYSQVLRKQPLASWPLKEVTYTTAEDISGNNIDATYSGSFAKGLPLVSNGESGVIFLDNTSEIEYPVDNIMTYRKEYKPFALEMSVLVNCDDRSLDNPILLFGQNFSGEFQGVYLEDNYIYFKPSYTENYSAQYQVDNWNQKFHIVANYNNSKISLYVNGQLVDTKDAADYVTNTNDFLSDITSFLSIGSSDYTYVLDSISIYQTELGDQDVLNHYTNSNFSSNYNLYLSSLAKPYYNFSVENEISAYRITLDRYLSENKFVKTNKFTTLPYIAKQYIEGTPTFNTVGSRASLQLNNSYFEIEEILASQEKIYKTLGISFYLNTAETKSNNTILYATSENAVIEAYITDDDTLNLKVNGESASVTLTTGWHDILFVSDTTGSVYVDGVQKLTTQFYLGNYNYILVGSSLNQSNYFNGNVSYLSLSSETPLDYLNYNRDAELYLALSTDMHWSQNVSESFLVYIPDSINLHTSKAVSKYTSPNISITYNSGTTFPRNGVLTELAGGTQTEELFNVTLNMTTNNSEDDLPKLYEFYIHGLTNNGKNLTSKVNGVSANIIDLDEVQLGKSLNSFISKSSDIGAIIKNTTIEFQGLLNDTQTISFMGRLLDWDGAARILLDSDIVDGPKIWWDGSAWQTREIDSIFFNGSTAIDEDAIANHYFYLTAVLGTPVTSSDNLILGSDIHALIFIQNENIEDTTAIEEQYLVLNGISLEPLTSNPENLTITDNGLSVYNFVWETI